MKRLSFRLGGAAAVVTLLACGAGYATTYAAFNSTADGRGQYAAGTVFLTSNSGIVSWPNAEDAEPGVVSSGCVQVTYGGSLPARVRIYSTRSGTITPYLSIKITRGTGAGTFPSCTGFTTDPANYIGAGAGVIYDGALTSFPDTGPAGQIDATIGVNEEWTTGEAHVYKIDVTLSSDLAARDKTGTLAFGFYASNL
jgi:hypothetical protein